jgi:RNA methyltransferase, TrmH family
VSIERIHGYRAGLAVLATRPDDVHRIACTRAVLPDVEALLGKREIHVGVLPEAKIERLARSPQHEGLCLEANARPFLSIAELTARLEKRGTAIALDRVRNSYNIGAIVRTAAFFGVDAVILGAPAPHPGLDPNAVRVAEGGAEHVAFARTTDLADTLGRLRAKGVRVYGTDGHAEADALSFRYARPCVVVLGNEREGMGPRVRTHCDAVVAIRGSGAIESLNVGIAASLLIAHLR